MARNAKHIVHEIYSDVMFELAQEAGLIDQVTDDLEAISGVLQDEPARTLHRCKSHAQYVLRYEP